MTEEALVFSKVSYAYPGAPRESLSDVHLSIMAGEWVGVVGPTNAGKSTLCLLAMGLAPHFFGGRLKGSVVALGKDSLSLSVAERSVDVGLLFQNPFTQISGARERVDDEIAFGPESHGLPRAEIDERVEEAIRLVGLEGLAARHPGDLSGGQLQRLALAALLAMRPRLLLLDEPTSQLDPAGTAAIFEVLAGLHGSGITIVMVENRLENVCELCPRIVALVGGRLLTDGAPDKVFNLPAVAERVGTPVYTRLAARAQLPSPHPVRLAEAAAAFRRRRG
ncbi:MAG: energy-coupling factor ABC transporter ATP-binding protein [Candidatus Dormibacteraeota bacterium]|nr:energy-coupling factor ABC transporter ATP-binding protein [Candidatus Dormibacteraeota bacterium]